MGKLEITKPMNFIVEYNKKSFQLSDFKPELASIRKQIDDMFCLKPDTYRLCYLDTENDPIMVEDDDDLAVCILEFSETSKVEDPVKLLVIADATRSPIASPRVINKSPVKSLIIDDQLELEKKITTSEPCLNDNESVL